MHAAMEIRTNWRVLCDFDVDFYGDRDFKSRARMYFTAISLQFDSVSDASGNPLRSYTF